MNPKLIDGIVSLIMEDAVAKTKILEAITAAEIEVIEKVERGEATEEEQNLYNCIHSIHKHFNN